MGNLTQTTTQVQSDLDGTENGNIGLDTVSDLSDTTATAARKSGFHSLGASSSNAPSTDRSVLITGARDVDAAGEIRSAQIVITESGGLYWSKDDGGVLASWLQAASRTGSETLTNKTLASPTITGDTTITSGGNQLTLNTTATRVFQGFQESGVDRFFIGTLGGSDGFALIDADGSTVRVSIDAAGATTFFGNFLAGSDNALTNGGASNRWSVVYAGTGTINTSDAREKTAVGELSADEIQASKLLAREIGVYKWLAAVAEKGDAARKHIGLTVQRAIEIMESCNLDPFEYGFICYDEWDDEFFEHPAVEALEATEDSPAVEASDAWTEQTKWAGNLYGLRYDELLSFVAAGFSARLEALEA